MCPDDQVWLKTVTSHKSYTLTKMYTNTFENAQYSLEMYVWPPELG